MTPMDHLNLYAYNLAQHDTATVFWTIMAALFIAFSVAVFTLQLIRYLFRGTKKPQVTEDELQNALDAISEVTLYKRNSLRVACNDLRKLGLEMKNDFKEAASKLPFLAKLWYYSGFMSRHQIFKVLLEKPVRYSAELEAAHKSQKKAETESLELRQKVAVLEEKLKRADDQIDKDRETIEAQRALLTVAHRNTLKSMAKQEELTQETAGGGATVIGLELREAQTEARTLREFIPHRATPPATGGNQGNQRTGT